MPCAEVDIWVEFWGNCKNKPWSYVVTALLAEKQQVQKLGLECALCAQEIAKRVAGLYQRRQERAPGEDEQEGKQSDLVGAWGFGSHDRGQVPTLSERERHPKVLRLEGHNLSCLLCWEENGRVARRRPNLGLILMLKLTKYTSWLEVRNEREGTCNDDFWPQQLER